jgi:hypothetical protein
MVLNPYELPVREAKVNVTEGPFRRASRVHLEAVQ